MLNDRLPETNLPDVQRRGSLFILRGRLPLGGRSFRIRCWWYVTNFLTRSWKTSVHQLAGANQCDPDRWALSSAGDGIVVNQHAAVVFSLYPLDALRNICEFKGLGQSAD